MTPDNTNCIAEQFKFEQEKLVSVILLIRFVLFLTLYKKIFFLGETVIMFVRKILKNN